MRDRLIELFSASVELIEGSNGVFEIAQETIILFTKETSGSFPTENDLKTLRFK